LSRTPGHVARKRRQQLGLENIDVGFRLAMIPEPGTGLLVIIGLLGIGLRRKMRP